MDKKISEFIEVYTLEDNTVIPIVQGDPLYNAKISTKNFVLGIISDIKAELGDFDLDDKYLSKTKPDTAQGHMTFNDGITSKEAVNFGEYTSGIHTGSGGRIDKNGKAELDSLILRSFLEVPELRYNRLEFVGDELAIGGGSVIKNVTTLSAVNGAYRIELKLEDGDIGPFIKYDIIKGIFNYSGGFNTTWASVDIVEGDKNQFLNVTVRANDSKGEWRNYPPRKFMHITRWGNVSSNHKDRQSVIFLSSKTANIIILDGVDSFDGGYINSQWGKPGGLTDSGGPLQHAPIDANDSLLYLRTLAVENLIRIDFEGRPIRELKERGEWAIPTLLNPYRLTSTIQDAVWHNAKRYRCMFDKTTLQPGGNSHWELIVDLNVEPGSGEPGEPGEPGKPGDKGDPGEPGKGISNIVRYYLASTYKTGITYSTSGWTTDPNNALLTAQYKYLWSYDHITYTDGTDKKTIPAVTGAYGDKGDAGNIGEIPVPYQAGKWFDFIQYTRTSRSYPVVQYETLYYYLSKETVITGGRNPKDDWAANDSNTVWRLADNFKMIITDALFADFAKLGSFVFKDNVMWSQQGSTPNYTDPGFVPNLEIDGETGKIKAKDAEISGKIESSEGEIGGFSINNDGLSRGFWYATRIGGTGDPGDMSGTLVHVTGNVHLDSSGVSISSSYGGTTEHPTTVEWSAQLTSMGIKVGNMEMRMDGIYRDGTKIL